MEALHLQSIEKQDVINTFERAIVKTKKLLGTVVEGNHPQEIDPEEELQEVNLKLGKALKEFKAITEIPVFIRNNGYIPLQQLYSN